MNNTWSTLAGRGRWVVVGCLGTLALAHAVLLVLSGVYPDLDRLDGDLSGHLYQLCKHRSAAPGRPLVLTLGDSRMAMAFCPAALPGLSTASGQAPLVFNFARLAASPNDQAEYFRVLLAYDLAPDYLVLEVFPPYLTHGGADSRKSKHSLPTELGNQFQRWMSRPWGVGRRLISLHHTPFTVALSGGSVGLGRDESGWVPLFRSPLRKPETVAAQVRKEYGLVVAHGLAVSDASRQAHRLILQACRERGIPVVLMELPEASFFRGLYSPQARRDVQEYINSLCREYGVGYVDARCWAADADFYDGYHLYCEAAVPFSQRLGREVLAPLLQGRPVGGTGVLQDNQRFDRDRSRREGSCHSHAAAGQSGAGKSS